MGKSYEEEVRCSQQDFGVEGCSKKPVQGEVAEPSVRQWWGVYFEGLQAQDGYPGCEPADNPSSITGVKWHSNVYRTECNVLETITV